jgi:thiamine monophosphate synthase
MSFRYSHVNDTTPFRNFFHHQIVMVAELCHKQNIPVTIHKFSKLAKAVQAERIEATRARPIRPVQKRTGNAY